MDFVRVNRVNREYRIVFLKATFFVNSSKPSIMRSNPSPSVPERCLERDLDQLAPLGSPKQSHLLVDSSSISNFASYRVDSIACQSGLRHGIEIMYRISANSLLLNQRDILFVSNVFTQPGFPIKHQISDSVGLYEMYESNNILVQTIKINIFMIKDQKAIPKY